MAYHQEIIDILRSSKAPYANRCASILDSPDTPRSYGYLAIAECIVELETKLQEATNKLLDIEKRKAAPDTKVVLRTTFVNGLDKWWKHNQKKKADK